MPLQDEQQIRTENAARLKRVVANLAYQLKLTRLQRRLCIEEVALATGLHKEVIKRIESGVHCFHIKTVEPLILYYGLYHYHPFLHHHTAPTPEQWKDLKKMQKQLKRYLKSRKKKLPVTGVQLVLGFK